MKMVKIVLILWVLFFVLILIIAGCSTNTDVVDEEGSDDVSVSSQTQALQQTTITEEVIVEEPELPVCGDGECEEIELETCEEDCPSCNDNNECTVDSFDLTTLSCKNVKIKGCCGDGICDPDEECAEDCPTRRLTLASYPYPFVHGDELEADIVVGDEGTTKEVTAATAIATGLGVESTIFGVMESDITTIRNTNVILIGNPCTNGFIAELIPYTNDCLEDYEEGEGRLSLFVTGESGGRDTYALVVSGYSADDVRRVADILGEYERNMAMLKGMSVKV